VTSGRDTELAERIRAVLDAAAGHVFGTEPGRLAAELYDVLVRITDDADRARVAAALARCWSYGGRPDRAAKFSEEALARAEAAGDPVLVADCLDAVLACHWGPDDLPLRTANAARLDEVSAHVLDPQARLQAQLWGLQVACETLQVQAIRRHLRALDRLGQESPRARFFAASRRWMYDMLCGRTDRAQELIAAAEAAGTKAGLADAWMVVASMRGFTALQEDDTALAAEMGEGMEAFARDEGIAGITAVGAWVWARIGNPGRVRSLLGELRSEVLEALPRDFTSWSSSSALSRPPWRWATSRSFVRRLASSHRTRTAPWWTLAPSMSMESPMTRSPARQRCWAIVRRRSACASARWRRTSGSARSGGTTVYWPGRRRPERPTALRTFTAPEAVCG
jgi:hypothetical protein